MAISNNTIKRIKSLRLKKFRQKYNNFIAEGDKIAQEALMEVPQQIVSAYALPEWAEQHRKSLEGIPLELVEEHELKKLSQLTTPNRVLLVIELPDTEPTYPLANEWSLYLDGIQDPGNMGTILRTADWFGLSKVYCAPNCVDVHHPKVVQATMGALFRTHCQTMILPDLLAQVSTIPIYGATTEGQDIFGFSHPQAGIIAIGNEGNGLSTEARGLITQPIAIPAAAHSRAESLNAGMATGIICAVLTREK